MESSTQEDFESGVRIRESNIEGLGGGGATPPRA